MGDTDSELGSTIHMYMSDLKFTSEIGQGKTRRWTKQCAKGEDDSEKVRVQIVILHDIQ